MIRRGMRGGERDDWNRDVIMFVGQMHSLNMKTNYVVLGWVRVHLLVLLLMLQTLRKGNVLPDVL